MNYLTLSPSSANPYPLYRQLRQNGGICPFTTHNQREGVWLVTGYEVVQAILRDEWCVRDSRNALDEEQSLPPLWQTLSTNLLSLDRPHHTRIRSLISKEFTARIAEDLRPHMHSVANQIVDGLEQNRKMDVIREFAFPFTITIIGEILGIPADKRNLTRSWSNAQVMGTFVSYLRELIAERRTRPQSDLITRLVQAEETGLLSHDELIGTIVLIFVAGHETTMNMIGNGLLTLVTHPQEWERLKSDPSMIHHMIDELLRFDGSVEKAWVRWAARDMEVGGVSICRGDQIIASIASANRDETIFSCPDNFDIGRENSHKHLAFGAGIHYCAGAALGRVELEIALQTLVTRLPDIKLATGVSDLKWLTEHTMRGVQELPVVW